MRKRKGFTLIELVVAMAIFFVLIYMSFLTFSYVTAFSGYSRQKASVQENLSIITDQITKELRQCVTNSAELNPKGVTSPIFNAASNTVRELTDVLADTSETPPLNDGEYYTFGSSKAPILRFYIYDDNGIKHRICYTLDVPNDGSGYTPPHYTGTPRRYWPDSHYELCEILRSDVKNPTDDTTPADTFQPITEQVITNFTVIRPAESDKIIQIVIEAIVKGPLGKGAQTVRYIAQVTVRQ